MKEMRYRPKIDDHDFEFKTRHVRTFIESGSKVKVFVLFRGREMAYTEHGREILERVAQELSDISSVEMAAKLDGRKMTMVLAPIPEILKKRKQRKEAPRTEQTTQTSELASTETDGR